MKMALSGMIIGVISIAYAIMAIININTVLNTHPLKTGYTTITIINPAALQLVVPNRVSPNDMHP